MQQILSPGEKNYKLHLYLDIKNLFKNNKYKQVVKAATNYLNLYPGEINVIFMRAKSNKLLNNFEETIEDLKYILTIDEKDAHALAELYYTYYHLNRYEEALKILPLVYNTRVIKPHSVAISELVMRKQLGQNISKKDGTRSDYIKEQILNYNSSLAISHIEKHLIETEDNTAVFNEKIDIKKLYNIISESIDNKNKTNKEEFMEIHYFAIPNVGYNNDINCNFVKVVVIPNTNNILTMYPVVDVIGKNITELNIDFSIIFKEKEKVKSLSNSRIDKFNKKYNIK